ncbi:MAG: carbohydrate-binding domain-containing protein, partial [Oscillospiraceae bacterium]|nr:carbohydrate-binding domain-containing protein [Oscillospiraceae bacterium]
MKKTIVKTAAACGLCLTLLASSISVSAAYEVSARNRMGGMQNSQQQTQMFGGQMGGRMDGMNQMGGMPGGMGGQFGGMQQGGQMGGMVQMPTQNQQGAMGGMNQMGGMMQNGMVQTASSAGAIVTGTTTNSAASLEADYANAETITMSESNNDVTIKEAGTYIITGTCSDGNIKVKKGTTGVVLVLKDLDLTSTTGATLSVNKGAEAKIIVSGSVKLTDAENPADENSTDADVADAFDGAAIKVKAGASAYLTGTGTLTVNGSAKNGVKVSASDDGNGSLVIDGATININATNDAINAEYDLAILSGTLNITAGDDALHADRILTVGTDGSGPSITIKSCTEGVEATVVNLAGGTVNVTSTDDGVNAANSDGTYASMGYSINVTGAKLTVNAPRADGLDSNG